MTDRPPVYVCNLKIPVYKMKGNFGKLLDVDLSSGEVKDFKVPDEYYRDYISRWEKYPNGTREGAN